MKSLGIIAALAPITAMVLVTIYERLNDPSLTETQLFLKHWPLYLLSVVLLLLVFPRRAA